jgi:hypothetical protein
MRTGVEESDAVALPKKKHTVEFMICFVSETLNKEKTYL